VFRGGAYGMGEKLVDNSMDFEFLVTTCQSWMYGMCDTGPSPDHLHGRISSRLAGREVDTTRRDDELERVRVRSGQGEMVGS
jgi:hypothetical protein